MNSRRTASATVAANGAISAAGIIRTAVTAPTAAAPPLRNANTPRPTTNAHSPAQMRPKESSARRNAVLRATCAKAPASNLTPTGNGRTIERVSRSTLAPSG